MLIHSFSTNNHGGRGELDYHKGKMVYAVTFNNKCSVADFDPVTGIITSPLELTFPSTNGLYGIEFSPDASKVYATDFNNRDFSGKITSPNLFRYDFLSHEIKSWTIKNLGPFCANLQEKDSTQGLGQIEIGKDQKLYIPHIGGCQITVIENPNEVNPVLKLIDVNSVLSTGVSDHIQSDFLDQDLNSAIITPAEDLNICEGDSIRLSTRKNPLHSYQWIKEGELLVGEVDNELMVRTGGEFQVKVTTEYGCEIFSKKKEVKEVQFPALNLGPDTLGCAGQEIILDTKLGDVVHKWSNGSIASSIKIHDPGQYWVEVYNGKCMITDTINISFYDLSEIFVPNVFTPNEDGANDAFTIKNGTGKLKLDIYNRWGTQVFHSDDYRNDWTAKNLASGLYYYLISSDNLCMRNIKGWLQILQ